MSYDGILMSLIGGRGSAIAGIDFQRKGARGVMSVHSAADAASGYLYQCRYALLAALQQQAVTPGLQVSIECFDDVAFSESGSPTQMLQAKHSLTHKTMSDMAKQFWNTIGIWTKWILDHPGDLGNLKLSFVTTAKLGDKTGVSLLRPDPKVRDVKAAAKKLEVAAKSSKNKEVAWAVELFLKQPEDLRLQILDMVEMLDASPTIVDVRDRIAFNLRRACRAEHLIPFIERLEGWWFSLVIDALATPGGKLIPVSSIDSRIDDLREEFGPEKLPIDYQSASPSEATIELLEARPFVEQLRHIEVGPTGLKYAVLDYFRAREQRSRWARDGLLRHNELSDYEARLSENWGRKWGLLEGKVRDGMCNAELAVLGQGLYEETTQVCVSLRGVSEPFVSHGSYHILSDKKSIGWHPEFSKK